MSTTIAIADALRPALVATERAHLLALAEQELVDRDAAREALRDPATTAGLLEGDLVEAGIAEAALRISVRNHLAGLKEAFLAARTALIERAAPERARQVELGGEAVNLADLLLAHERVLARHTQRIGDLMGRLNLSPAGDGLPKAARDRIGGLLGFARADASGRDALTARDHLAELAHLHAGTASSLARIHGELSSLGGRISVAEAPVDLAAAAADALGAALALEAAGGEPLPQAEQSWAIGARVIVALRALGDALHGASLPSSAGASDAVSQDAAESVAIDEVRQHRELLNALGLQLADASLELEEGVETLLAR
ncbi:hypothetical protein [Arenivirga flava]|uniref:Uncharacterized protein n=1 Tax=Arenivirga flava TaxID=1930060 RepID=A0AA37UGE7_9MICO|nr:hypothetical protein [Arenivirga flava]GMA28840.1 hypothetical protein GCM10025874_20930 [Arenivirga flava]